MHIREVVVIRVVAAQRNIDAARSDVFPAVLKLLTDDIAARQQIAELIFAVGAGLLHHRAAGIPEGDIPVG